MGRRSLRSRALVVCIAGGWACSGGGSRDPGTSTSPTTPPSSTAGCAQGATYCLPYDFAGGDTCTACTPGPEKTAAECHDPAFEVITWQLVAAINVPSMEDLDWDCYARSDGSACYLNHQCTPPPGHPDSFSLLCANEKTQTAAPGPLTCSTTRYGVELSILPRTNLEFWSLKNTQHFVPGAPVSVEAVVWIPQGMAAEIGIDCGSDADLSERQGQSGSQTLGAGRWEVLKESFQFDVNHSWCTGWGQILNAAEFPPADGEGVGGTAYLGSYSTSGTLAP